jgi:DNA/RNA-binding domain of Phe-tRNA-synthetase-like protein
LVDTYNAVAMKYMVPIGGEDWDSLESDLVRRRARGDEPFLGNQPDSAPELADAGEPIWIDAGGVTTRRFNWRQAKRTRITLGTRAAYFVFDAVAPYSRAHVESGAAELLGLVRERWPSASAELVAI